jgi:cell division GTPase FtsZ
VVGNKSTLTEAFSMANDVLAQGVRSIYELITIPGIINVDFGDIKAIMTGTGGAIMGVGVGKGEHRAIEAVKKACSNPLIDKSVIDGATNILMCVTGGENLKLDEINQCTMAVYEATDPNCNITLGVVYDPKLTDEVKVTIIATGFKEDIHHVAEKPQSHAGEKKEAIRTRPAPAGAGKSEAPHVTLKEKLESMLAAENKNSEETRSDEPKSEHPSVFKEEQQDFVVNFNRPDNPLRRLRNEDKLEEPVNKEEEPKEMDLDSPAFLRRRRSLFD